MTYGDQLRSIANQYFEAHGNVVATRREIAAWAIDQNLWHPQPSDLVDQCADQIARAMKEEYYIDPQGRSVRAKHAARIKQDGVQLTLWADARTAPRSHMKVAFQQRREQIVGECRQLKADVDSFNDNRSPDQPIQMSFNFTFDLEELEAAAQAVN